MTRARASCSPFRPQPGPFISWCKHVENGVADLPDANTLYVMIMHYSARRGLYNLLEAAYAWQANAHYRIFTRLSSTMRAQGLSEQELRLKCRCELQKMAACIQTGEQIPPPCAPLEKLYVPASLKRLWLILVE